MEKYVEIFNSYHEKDYFDNVNNIEIVKKNLTDLINILIFADKENDEKIFDSFIRFQFINDLTYLSIYINSKEILLQIIKSFSMLILSIKNQKFLIYLFNKNFLNKIIDIKSYIFNIDFDYDFLSYYTNFLKSLSLKLDENNISYFYHEKSNTFKLLENALNLYNYNDNMIINVIRNIFLTIGKHHFKNYENEYLITLPNIEYFALIACHLREKYIRLMKEYLNEDKNEKRNDKIKDFSDEIISDIMYFNDIIELYKDNNTINNIILNCLFYYFIMPILLKDINHEVNIFVLTGLLYFINNDKFSEIFFNIFFNDKISDSLIKFINNTPDFTKNYSFEYNENNVDNNNLGLDSEKENVKILNFVDYINNHFNKKFIKALIKNNNIIGNDFIYFDEVKEINKLIDQSEKFSDSENFYIQFLLEKFFNKNQYEEIRDYHYNLSISTGECVGIYEEKKDKENITKQSFLYKYNEYKNDLNNNSIENFKENLIIKKLNVIFEKTNISNKNINQIIVKNFFINSIVTNKYFQFYVNNLPRNIIMFLINILFYDNNLDFKKEANIIAYNSLTYIYKYNKDLIYPQEMNLIKKLYLLYISGIINIFLIENEIKNNCFEILESVWNDFNSLNIKNMIIKQMQRSNLLVSLEDSINDPISNEKNFKFYLYSYLQLNKFFINSDDKNENQINFPILYDKYYSYNINDEINLNNLENNDKTLYFKCSIDDKENCFVVVYNNLIIFGEELKNKKNVIKINRKFKLKKIDFEITYNEFSEELKKYFIFTFSKKDYKINVDNNNFAIELYGKLLILKENCIKDESFYFREHFENLLIIFSNNK